jgi:shikimate kinase
MNFDGDIIFLVGPMGSGKTTVGRRVAELLGLEFVDCDEAIEKRTGASINLIFDIEGEQGFRKRETDILAELSSVRGRLIATGGGAVLSEENRRLMSDRGHVVWLKTPLEQQVRRLAKDKKRPLLHTPDWRQRLADLAAERDPLYSALADVVFDSPGRSVQSTAQSLADSVCAALGPENESGRHAVR